MTNDNLKQKTLEIVRQDDMAANLSTFRVYISGPVHWSYVAARLPRVCVSPLRNAAAPASGSASPATRPETGSEGCGALRWRGSAPSLEVLTAPSTVPVSDCDIEEPHVDNRKNV